MGGAGLRGSVQACELRIICFSQEQTCRHVNYVVWLHNPRNLCIWVDLHTPSGESEQALTNLVPRPPPPPFFWSFAVCLTLIKRHSQAKPVPIPSFFFAKTCCKLHVNYAVLCFRFSGKVQDAEMCQCSSSQVPEVTASPRAVESYLSHVISLCAFQLKHLFWMNCDLTSVV